MFRGMGWGLKINVSLVGFTVGKTRYVLKAVRSIRTKLLTKETTANNVQNMMLSSKLLKKMKSVHVLKLLRVNLNPGIEHRLVNPPARAEVPS